MKKAIKILAGAGLFLLGAAALCVLFGEPDPEAGVGWAPLLFGKAAAGCVMYACVKAAMRLFPEWAERMKEEKV